MTTCNCWLGEPTREDCPKHNPCPTCKGYGWVTEVLEDINGRSPRFAYPRCPTCSPAGTRKYWWSGPDQLAALSTTTEGENDA